MADEDTQKNSSSLDAKSTFLLTGPLLYWREYSGVCSTLPVYCIQVVCKSVRVVSVVVVSVPSSVYRRQCRCIHKRWRVCVCVFFFFHLALKKNEFGIHTTKKQNFVLDFRIMPINCLPPLAPRGGDRENPRGWPPHSLGPASVHIALFLHLA